MRKIEWTDNQDCIELIEGKSSGIFDLLDEESKLPKPKYDHFTGEVHSRNKNHFRLSVSCETGSGRIKIIDLLENLTFEKYIYQNYIYIPLFYQSSLLSFFYLPIYTTSAT